MEERERSGTDAHADADLRVTDGAPAAAGPRPRPAWRRDAGALLRLSLPLVLTALFTRTLMVQDLILIGHFVDTDAVAATALGTTLYQMFYYFLLGMGSAVDTMCSQSHGAGAHVDTVLWAQRGLLILSLASVPMMVVLGLGSEWILRAVMLQDAGVAAMAASYVRILLIGMPASICFDVLVKFLQSQRIMMPFLYVSMSMNVFNIGLDVWLLSTVGFVGAPIATTACRYLSILLLGAYVWCARLHERHAAFPGWRLTEIADATACAQVSRPPLSMAGCSSHRATATSYAGRTRRPAARTMGSATRLRHRAIVPAS